MSILNFAQIAGQLPDDHGRLIIAYSGGVDSQVLLHLCAGQAELRSTILAVYVDHGLQSLSTAWSEHCSKQAQDLGVSFSSIKVDARPSVGESPEAAARRARYQALQSVMQQGDLLLLAQHREDQMETMLLQLFRGAGIRGLAAMPVATQFGVGMMLRPLLHIPKQNILDYAEAHGLSWIEDPSNQRDDFDRNFLRNQVVPLLRQRWPSLDKTVARSAQHCGEAFELLRNWSDDGLRQVVVDAYPWTRLQQTDDCSLTDVLQLERLAQYSQQQRHWLLREWLFSHGLKPPSQAVLATIESQLIAARDDAEPLIRLQGRCLKKYRQQLFCLDSRILQPPLECQWPPATTALALNNGYRLDKVLATSGIAKDLWDTAQITVRPRRGGEKLKLPRREGRHCLKKLYQEAAIPPWERQSRPLIYLDDRLAAVPGLWVDEWAWRSGSADTCYQLICEYPSPEKSIS